VVTPARLVYIISGILVPSLGAFPTNSHFTRIDGGKYIGQLTYIGVRAAPLSLLDNDDKSPAHNDGESAKGRREEKDAHGSLRRRVVSL
jgi:hypothetical protein